MRKTLLFVSIALVVAVMAVCLPMSFAWADTATSAEHYLDLHNEEFVGAVVIKGNAGATDWNVKAMGYADRENEYLVDAEETVFDWGELSELLVWACLDKLAAQGDLDLSAKISAYVAGIKTPKGEPTIADLYNHQSGFAQVAADLYANDDGEVKTLAETAKNAPQQTFAPKEVTSYTAYDATLAAYIVEVVSRQSYEQYVAENVLEPLGLNKTAVAASLWDNADVHTSRNLTMTYSSDGKLSGKSRLMSNYYPAVSAAGSAKDLAKLCNAIAEGTLSRKGLNEGNIAIKLSTALSAQAGLAINFDSGLWLVVLTNSPQNHVAEGAISADFATVKAPAGVYRPVGKVARSSSFAWVNRADIRWIRSDSEVLCLAVGEDGTLLTASGTWEPVPLHEIIVTCVFGALALLAFIYAIVVLVVNFFGSIAAASNPNPEYPVHLQRWQTTAAGTLLLLGVFIVYSIFSVLLGNYGGTSMVWKSWVIFALAVIGLGHVVALPIIAVKQPCSKKRVGMYAVTAFAIVIIIASVAFGGFLPF